MAPEAGTGVRAPTNGSCTVTAASTKKIYELNVVEALRRSGANRINAKAGLTEAHAALADAQATHSRTVTVVQQGAEAQENRDDANAAVGPDQAARDQAAAQVRASVSVDAHPRRTGTGAASRVEGGADSLSAVVTLGNPSHVWGVVDPNAMPHQVTAGRETDSLAEGARGVPEPDSVVFRGFDLVHEGTPVKSSPAGP